VNDNCVLVTGGAGFIGANFVLQWVQQTNDRLVNLDKLTYAGNPHSLASVRDDQRHVFVKGDIANRHLVVSLLETHKPCAVVNFAAESHVDRSILGADAFVQTNIVGTFQLLEALRLYHSGLSETDARRFRFLHVSTDEVYGSLGPNEPAFRETTGYAPNSPYAASKAGSDHLVRAWHHTYGLPTLITSCSNNYGPMQFPEKLIPLIVLNAIQGESLPLYGDGRNVRDWLYVSDHCDALRQVLRRGVPGAAYNIGGESERQNIEVVEGICSVLDELLPSSSGPYSRLITFVRDRPGHDKRYAIDCSKIKADLGWRPSVAFGAGLRATVEWYLNNPQWVRTVQTGGYREWVELNYPIERAS
jgi:dTDP-glucose 4,6-dehydratase